MTLPGLAPAGEFLSLVQRKEPKKHARFLAALRAVPCATPLRQGLFRQCILAQSEEASASCLAPVLRTGLLTLPPLRCSARQTGANTQPIKDKPISKTAQCVAWWVTRSFSRFLPASTVWAISSAFLVESARISLIVSNERAWKSTTASTSLRTESTARPGP